MDIMQAWTLMRHMFNEYHAGRDLNKTSRYITQAYTLNKAYVPRCITYIKVHIGISPRHGLE